MGRPASRAIPRGFISVEAKDEHARGPFHEDAFKRADAPLATIRRREDCPGAPDQLDTAPVGVAVARGQSPPLLSIIL